MKHLENVHSYSSENLKKVANNSVWFSHKSLWKCRIKPRWIELRTWDVLTRATLLRSSHIGVWSVSNPSHDMMDNYENDEIAATAMDGRRIDTIPIKNPNYEDPDQVIMADPWSFEDDHTSVLLDRTNALTFSEATLELQLQAEELQIVIDKAVSEEIKDVIESHWAVVV